MTRLKITPLTRLEGHGEVELILQRGQLAEARVCLTESPRLFESIVTGHRYDEVPDLVCRICSICSTVHKLTSLAALEQAMNVRIPPAAELVRELLLLGGHIQSHALHLFLLVLPDFFDEESIVPLLKQKHPLAAAGLDLKAYGNFLQELMGGRVVHPVSPVFGGVSHRPTLAQLGQLVAETEHWRQRWPGIAAEFIEMATYPKSNSVSGEPLSVSQKEGPSLSGVALQCGDSSTLPLAAYSELLKEHLLPHSYAKISGDEGKTFRAGALSRLVLLHRNDEAGFEVVDDDGFHANNTAQLVETGWALERVARLLARLIDCSPGEPLVAEVRPPEAGIGTAAMEAPRGLLIHHYVINEWGMVVSADIVTPTAINQKAMAEQILADLHTEKNHDILKRTSERIIRSYDPCISCAVHVLER